MKIFLNYSEIKTIRASLYSTQNSLSKSLKDDPGVRDVEKVREVVEEGVSEVSRLILYFNDILQSEP